MQRGIIRVARYAVFHDREFSFKSICFAISLHFIFELEHIILRDGTNLHAENPFRRGDVIHAWRAYIDKWEFGLRLPSIGCFQCKMFHKNLVQRRTRRD